MRFHQEWIDKILTETDSEYQDCDCMGCCERMKKQRQEISDKLEIILRDFRQSAIATGRLAGMRDAQARRVGGGSRKRK